MPLFERLLSVMAPHRCIECGSEGSLLCSWCLPGAFPPVPSRCFGCQKAATDSATCINCRRRLPIKRIWAVTEYQGLARKLLRAYKFERALSAAPIIARAIAETLPYLPKDTIIVPVPTATIRIRQRGYDHAQLIARHTAMYKGLAMVKAASRLTQSRQVGSNRQQRKTQLQGAFVIIKPSIVQGSNILIIDDVATTGATLESLAAELKKSGAKTICAVVLAQKH